MLNPLIINPNHYKMLHQILKKYWGYDQFRPLQEEIAQSVLDGNDTLALLPTGGGKSICFQVPALAQKGMCLVISPLIALMKDQVENLKKRGIKAEAIYSGLSNHEIDRILGNSIHDPEFKFLYVSPERLKTDGFRVNLQQMKITLLAVDEAHCISQWGYDFRPPYLEIAEIRKFFPKVPVLALTATATPEVVNDIQERLHFRKKNVFQKSFRRENLTYFVMHEENKMGRLLRLIEKNPGTGIVYVRNRRRTQEIAEYLQHFKVTADFYHAGLDNDMRDKKQSEWMSGKTQVIVSTNAFGMGIDKPDVRWVVHLDIPDTLEAYFQEAGRGGRDLKPSIAVMLYDNNDIKELKNNLELSFPPITTIRNVYKTLSEHYRIPIGEGENKIVPFDPDKLCKKLKLRPIELINALSFLEKTGVLMLSEDVKKQSTLHFVADEETLRNFYHKNNDKQEFVKLLLRSYGGLFSNYVKISEEEIARRAEMKVDDIEALLLELSKKNIVQYSKRSAKPHILFLQNRVPENYLYFKEEVYKKRKKVAQKRLDSVFHFVENVQTCRSQLLLAYFGETKSEPCGNCDVCRQIHSLKMKRKEQEAIREEIIKYKHLSHKEIIHIVSEQFPEKKVIEVLRQFLEQTS
ncbi:MAG: RecQ family ATP-dependent DNA helicase [Bacteroidetes bacterium]|nr:RecQ family ATP-dependent DNA helicase [Bacteroidota bacterium]MCL2303218.1 RecQ family ATP-dependent DNA helicase [Lentimicrobiaceae bacterium]